jgi:hypothetical protein
MRHDDTKRSSRSSLHDAYIGVEEERGEANSNNNNHSNEQAQAQAASNSSSSSTIAIFGASGKTGNAFIRLALNAGYSVRALIHDLKAGNLRELVSHQDGQQHQHGQLGQLRTLQLVTGTLEDEHQLAETVRGANYVVCMLGETLPTKHKYPVGGMTAFLGKLYPIMKRERSVSVFLYQVRNKCSSRMMVSSNVCCVSFDPLISHARSSIEFNVIQCNVILYCSAIIT